MLSLSIQCGMDACGDALTTQALQKDMTWVAMTVNPNTVTRGASLRPLGGGPTSGPLLSTAIGRVKIISSSALE